MPDPDHAATVVMLRNDAPGFEVLMVERNARGFFGSMVVFPGGRVDECDSPSGGNSGDDESHRLAAVREVAEETGILLTADGPRQAPGLKGAAFHNWVVDQGVTTAASSLVLVSRWVTPVGAPRRFDTRFYLASCDHAPDVQIDTEELIGYRWIRPGEALRSYEAGEMNLILPTLSHLRWLERRRSIEDAVASAVGADGRTLIRPEQVEDGSMLQIQMPAETA